MQTCRLKMMRIRENSRLEKIPTIQKFWESKELLWSKMKIERDWKLQGKKHLDEKGGREPNMNENLYNEKHKLTNEKQKVEIP